MFRSSADSTDSDAADGFRSVPWLSVLLGVGVLISVVAAPTLTARASSVVDVYQHQQAPFPFVWRDVMTVYLLSALPAAALLSRTLQSRLPRVFTMLVGLLLVMSCVLAIFAFGGTRMVAAESAGLWLVLRPGLALLATTGILLPRGEVPQRLTASGKYGPAAAVGMLAVSLAILLLVPVTYEHARLKHDTEQVGGLIEQSRLSEALALLDRIILRHPSARWQQQSLRVIRADLRHQTAELTAAVDAALPATATINEQLQRGQQFAVLGRNAEAIQVLTPLTSTSMATEACNLLGTIHESQLEWGIAAEWYQQARRHCDEQPGADGSPAGKARALQGTAYCSRRLGLLEQAEAAWLQLLEIEPTADTHYLLACFFEDTQQTLRALHHAEQAMNMSPSRYSEKGQRLIDKLQTMHFGCLNVVRN